MFKFSKKILSVVILAAFALPFLSLAAGLQLETIYPASPSAQQVITGHTKLPDIIRYAVSWTIIIAALVTAFSLIYAGVQYLTSVGRPNAVAAAKKRIGQCLLGLLIIASSYLVLQTINPQLTIMTIKKQQVGAGIVMFTQAGLYGSDKDASGVVTPDKCYMEEADANGCGAGSITDCYNPNMVNGFNTPNSDTLENLIKASEARFLSYDMPNLVTEFGNMAKISTNIANFANIVNFTKFPLYAIGFWGDENTQGGGLIANTKIFAYPNTQYNIAPPHAGRAIEYTVDGKVGSNGDIPGNDGRASCKADTAGSGAADFEMKLITMYSDFAPNFKSDVTYYDKTLYDFDPNNPGQPIRGEKDHPPLSIKVQGEGLGVILYSQTSGGSQTFAASAEDFNLSNIKFDNLADDIKVDNTASMAKLKKECNAQPNPTECMIKGWRRDFLAIVHSGYYFTGDLRMFFEKRGKSPSLSNTFPDDPPIQFPKLYEDFDFSNEVDLVAINNDPKYFNCMSATNPLGCYCNSTNLSLCDNVLGGSMTAFADTHYFYVTEPLNKVGNQDEPTPAAGYTKIAINEADRFGRLNASDKASSLEIFEIEKKQGAFWDTRSTGGDNYDVARDSRKQPTPVCREVKLCTGKGLLNDCLVFVPNTPEYIKNKYIAPDRFNSIVLPMPLYLPINLPKEFKKYTMKYKDENGATEIAEFSASASPLRVKMGFNDNIKSLSIDGDCVVVLFENGIKDMAACKTCSNNGTADASCKKCWDGGGPGANSEVFTKSVNDLTTHSISKCGGREKFGFGDRKNCASAIAIFPLKKSEE